MREYCYKIKRFSKTLDRKEKTPSGHGIQVIVMPKRSSWQDGIPSFGRRAIAAGSDSGPLNRAAAPPEYGHRRGGVQKVVL